MTALSSFLLLAYAYWPAILGFLILLYLASNRYQKGLHRVPGPWIRSVSTLPRMWSVYKGQHQVDDLELHARYGKIVRLAPNLISIADPEEINQVYGISTKFIKAPFYDLSAFHDEEGLIPDTFVIREDKKLHSRMKRNAANAYSMNGLVQFEPWIEPVMTRLLNILDGHANNSTVCDLGTLVKYFAMDAVCSMTLGNDMGYLENGDYSNFFRTLDLYSVYMSIFGHIPWIHPWLLGNPKAAQFVTQGDTSTTSIMALASAELQRYRASPPTEGDTMTFLGRLSLNQDANEKSITNREIVTHAMGNISAGSDTTAIAMRSVLYNILKDKAVYDRLCSEIRSQLSLPVRFQAANNLPYLRAVIQEAMRIHPSVGQILARSVPAEGATVSGYYVGSGSVVGISPWVMHRNAQVFAEPDRFRPERWILGEEVKDEDHLRQMNRSFFTFGHGTHTCSGKHISIMEVSKLIPTLLLKYDLELVGDGGYKFTNWWFTQQEGLNVRLHGR